MIGGRINAQYSEVFVGRDADHARFPIGLIGQGHLCRGSILNHVKVGDDIAARVPDKSRAGSLGNLILIQREKVLLDRDVGDVHYRRRGLPKQANGCFLFTRELPARSYCAWRCLGIVERSTAYPRLFSS